MIFSSNKTVIVVLDYNKPEITNKCLNSIWKHNRLEIILVNSGNSTFETYTKAVPFHYIENRRGRYFSIGMNEGIKKAFEFKPKYVVLLNNDAEVTEGSIELLEKVLEENPKLGMVSSNRAYSMGKYIKKELKAESIENNIIFPVLKETNKLTGFCLCVRFELIQNIGGFDERFIFGKEDDDLSFRIINEGYSLGEVLNSIVLHYLSGSTNFKNKKSVEFLILGSAAGNALLFYKKEVSLLQFLFTLTKDIMSVYLKSVIESKKINIELFIYAFKGIIYGLTGGKNIISF